MSDGIYIEVTIIHTSLPRILCVRRIVVISLSPYSSKLKAASPLVRIHDSGPISLVPPCDKSIASAKAEDPVFVDPRFLHRSYNLVSPCKVFAALQCCKLS